MDYSKMTIGFSTGALSSGDFNAALSALRGTNASAIELSALRIKEFDPLLQALNSLPLERYDYIAIHAPSDFEITMEAQVAYRLLEEVPHKWNVVVHPDVIRDYTLWAPLGNRLCIENMDKRKSFGRTLKELNSTFDRLPNARLCLDLAHIRQVDPTMSQAVELIDAMSSSIAQIHISDLNGVGSHLPLSTAAINAYQRVASRLPHGIPVIIESVIEPSLIDHEIARVQEALSPRPVPIINRTIIPPHDNRN